MGEFGKVGTGTFQDYADVIGLTKEQAMLAAREFENMSSDQVIGKMVSEMEKAGATGNEMTFVLESMGNDLSRLIPLFVDGSKELNTLTNTYKKATEQMKLTSAEIAGLQEVATSFDLMTDSLAKAGSLISAQIAPLLNEFFTSVIETVPTATQVIVDFINSFKTPDEITNILSIQSQITEEENLLADAIERKNNLEQQSLLFTGSLTGQRQLQEVTWEIEGQVEILKELKDREAELTKQRVEDAEKLKSSGISAGGTGTGGTGDQVQAIADRFKTEEELLKQKLDNELIIAGENNELRLNLEKEYQEALSLIRTNADAEALSQGTEMVKLFESGKKKELDAAKKASDGKTKSEEAYLDAALSIGSTLATGNDDIQRTLIVANTAAGITRQFSDLPYPAALATSAAIGISGIAQLASVGSGSISGSSAETVAVAEAPEQTSELAISDQDESGRSESQILTLRFEGGGGDDELAVAMDGILKKAKVTGSIS